MTSVVVRGVSLSFGVYEVLKSLNLDVPEGEFLVLLGPSGCGKSTLLNCIAGLLDVSEGQIFIKGKNVTWEEPKDRGIGMVFQSYALYPHMSVRQNLAFGLENTKIPKPEIAQRIAEAARMLEIEPYLERRPGQLSGGQRQRVAIGRAIVRRPVAFLLDEPLSNLDAELRVSTRAELAALHARLSATMIYVTHDQVEAMTLADRIVVLRAGRIEQVGTPLELYNSPANRFVAGFIGAPHMNFLEATVEARQAGRAVAVLNGGHRLEFPLDDTATQLGARVTVGVRPHHVAIGNGEGGIPARIRLVEALGSETVVHTDVAGQKVLVVTPGQHGLTPGSDIHLSLSAAPLHLFNDGGHRLGQTV